MLVSEEKAATIRDQLQVERKVWTNKPRYGLFSYLPDHNFGFRETNCNSTKNLRDEQGKVVTSPKNFQVGRAVTANPQIDAFTKTGYLCLNDEYIDPNKIGRLRESQSTRNSNVHSSSFRPSGGNFYKVKAPYQYMTDSAEPDQAAPPLRNFMTSPMKKGLGNATTGHLFSSYSYFPDPYDNDRMMSSVERREHASKRWNGPFQTTFKKRDHFTCSRKVFHDPDHLQGQQNRATSSSTGFRPFLNSDKPKKGYNCTINKFPQYKEEGPQQKSLNSTVKEGIWKDTYRERTAPTTSIKHYNSINRPRHRF